MAEFKHLSGSAVKCVLNVEKQYSPDGRTKSALMNLELAGLTNAILHSLFIFFIISIMYGFRGSCRIFSIFTIDYYMNGGLVGYRSHNHE